MGVRGNSTSRRRAGTTLSSKAAIAGRWVIALPIRVPLGPCPLLCHLRCRTPGLADASDATMSMRLRLHGRSGKPGLRALPPARDGTGTARRMVTRLLSSTAPVKHVLGCEMSCAVVGGLRTYTVIANASNQCGDRNARLRRQ